MAPEQRTVSYESASSHYLSPARRDPVKRLWEEPVNHRILAAALDALPLTDGPLRILDVGAGTGDGLALLEAARARSAHPDRALDYTGLDPDPAMVAAAQDAHRDRAGVRFVRGDVRDPLPDDDVDLYLSAGVPYSHLEHTEVDEVLARLLTTAARRPRPTALVVDVLGRYSLEWETRWHRTRWDYRMSFFRGGPDDDPDDDITAPMSVFDRASLEAALRRAVDRAGVDLASAVCHDRSVLVGRHTDTGAFTVPGRPPYRSLVNRLHDGDVDVDLTEMELEVPTTTAPAAVDRWFRATARAWNGRLERAAAAEARTGPDPAARARLAVDLRDLEHRTQQGLGVGHSLILLAVTRPRR